MNIDLNLDNYDLDDILNLFKISYDFNLDELKKAKRIVLQTHPDKCSLPQEYFLFFSSAYKILYSIYNFRTKSKCPDRNEYIADKDTEKELLLKSFLKKKNFNKIFNELFEKHYIKTEGVEKGYGDWLKSDKDIDFRETTKANMNETFEKKKKETKDLVIHTGVQEISSSSGNYGDLVDDCPENYSSGIFSSIQYEDLRKAHVESVVPVTNEDYNNIPKYKNVSDLQNQRTSQFLDPLTKEDSIEWLQKQNNEKDKLDVQRAYKLAKQDEKTQINDMFLSKFKLLS